MRSVWNVVLVHTELCYECNLFVSIFSDYNQDVDVIKCTHNYFTPWLLFLIFWGNMDLKNTTLCLKMRDERCERFTCGGELSQANGENFEQECLSWSIWKKGKNQGDLATL